MNSESRNLTSDYQIIRISNSPLDSNEQQFLENIYSEFAQELPEFSPPTIGSNNLLKTLLRSQHQVSFQQRRGRIERRQVISPSIRRAIEKSRSILNLGENWDEEGSPAYVEATWKRATDFIVQITASYRQVIGTWVEPPKITPGPEGSIDIRWKMPDRTLLINIPVNGDEPAEFYGDNKASDAINGTLDTSSQNQWILMWLMR